MSVKINHSIQNKEYYFPQKSNANFINNMLLCLFELMLFEVKKKILL